MDRDARQEVIRHAYAKQIMAAAGVSDRRLEAAFAAIRREDFLGRGPWQVVRWGRGYVPTPSRDPLYLYDDVLIGIIPERNLNNGQPSLHAWLIASAAPSDECADFASAGVSARIATLSTKEKVTASTAKAAGPSRRELSIGFPSWDV